MIATKSLLFWLDVGFVAGCVLIFVLPSSTPGVALALSCTAVSIIVCLKRDL